MSVKHFNKPGCVCRVCVRCGWPFFTPAVSDRIGGGKFCSRPCFMARGSDTSREKLTQRFWKKVGKTADCWYWAGTRTARRGYGRLLGPGKKFIAAHRFSWELHNGPIPAGLFVCHHCDTPGCVRPDHLFLGTNEENMADCKRKDRFHRPQGEKNNRAKLTEQQVREIRTRHAAGTPERQLCYDYDIDKSHLRNIVSGKAWAHLLNEG